VFVELSDTECSMDSELLVNKQVILVYFILSFKLTFGLGLKVEGISTFTVKTIL